MANSIKLEFDVPQLNVILNALGSQPYGQVFKIVEYIQQEAEKQLKESANESGNETTAG